MKTGHMIQTHQNLHDSVGSNFKKKNSSFMVTHIYLWLSEIALKKVI
jgi:hypothetical protein